METKVLAPAVLELKQKTDLELPVVLKNKVLLSPGEWNGLKFTKEEIKKAFENTDWSDKDNYALIFDHEEKAANWLGNVINIHLNEKGQLIGDLEFWDEDIARKLALGKAKLGISARVLGMEDDEGRFVDFTYNNFSVVYDPACNPSAYINLSKKKELEGETSSSTVQGKPIGSNVTEKIKYPKKKKKKMEEDADVEDEFYDEDEDLAAVTAFEKERKKRGMSPSQFYAAPRDPPSESKLPIFDASHVRNALARFNQTQFKSDEEKAKARRKVVAAAKKFGIKVSKMSYLTEAERRYIEENMSEEKEPETVEATPEESKEEETPSENSEELSSKLDLILSEIKTLSERIKKLEDEGDSDEPEEKPEEPPKEEPKEEPKESEESELANLKKEVAELKAEKDAPKSHSVVELGANQAYKGYTQGEMEMAKKLLEMTPR